jgi:hypothetical protein
MNAGIMRYETKLQILLLSLHNVFTHKGIQIVTTFFIAPKVNKCAVACLHILQTPLRVCALTHGHITFSRKCQESKIF